MKKLLKTLGIATLLAAFLGFGLVACSDDSSDSDGSGPGGQTSGETLTTPEVSSTLIYKTFDAAPEIADSSKSVKIYKTEVSEANLIDTIGAGEEKYYSGGRSSASQIGELTLKYQRLVFVEGNRLCVISHTDSNAYSKLEPSTKYVVVVEDGLLKGKTGIQWEFTTDATPTIADKIISVKQDGTGNFRTINDALNYIRKNGAANEDWTVKIAAGIYTERLYYYGDANITIEGEVKNGKYGSDVEIRWNNSNKNYESDAGTRGRAAALFGGKCNLVFKNITIRNTNTIAADNQAEAITHDASGTFIVYNCSFYSHQDTIYVGARENRSWFYKCYIEGDTDYLWGYADVALFEECELVCIHNGKEATNTKANAVLIAPRGDLAQKANKGFVLLNNKITIKDKVGLSFARNSGADTNGAIVNNTFIKEGSGFILPTLYTDKSNTQSYDANGDMAIGWKDYGNKYSNGVPVATEETVRFNNCADLTARVANREYNGRYVILNRGFDTNTEKYEVADEWDISAYETEFNATQDNSKNNVYIEPVAYKDIVGGSETLTFTGSKAGTWNATETTAGTIIESFTDGVLVTKPNVEGKVTITLTADGHTDTAYAYIIPTMIVAEKIVFSKEISKIDLYDTAEISAIGKTNDDVEATKKSITWTSSDTDVIKFVNSEFKAVDELTTTKANEVVTLYAVGTGSATITATHEDGVAATTETIKISGDTIAWTSVTAAIAVNTDVQSGTVAAFNGMVVDSTAGGKCGMKANTTDRNQCRNLTLYVPVKADCDIIINLTAAAKANNSGLDADGTKVIYTGHDASEGEAASEGPWYYTIKFDYETQAVEYSKATEHTPTLGNTASLDSTSKFAPIVFPYGQDCYWNRLSVNYKDSNGDPISYEYEVKDISIAFADTSDMELDLYDAANKLTGVRVVNASGADKDEAQISYTSDTPAVATVNPTTGVVTAVSKGKANIIAKEALTGTKASYLVKVVDTTPKGSANYFVDIGGDGTETDGDLTVVVNGSNSNGHGAEIKSTGTTSVKISLPAGKWNLLLGTCHYGTSGTPYKLECKANADFEQELISQYEFTSENCFVDGNRNNMLGDTFYVASESAMEITLNSNGVKEYLPFVFAVGL